MNQTYLSGTMSALSIVLMLGLMWLGDATPGAFALVGLGAALMATVCLISDL
jgi:hypothetical protein